ncbi:MAG: DASS family sodium-coupled anion symporter [Planctomycetaceae bacterium]
MPAEQTPPETGQIHTLGKVLGFVLFLLILFAPTPEGMTPAGQRMAAVTILMAVLWLTQAIPIAATSLIPLAAYPFLGILPAKEVSNAYIDANIFLFLGGFVIALGIEKWGLHRRMALHIVRVLGTSLPRVVLGFMVGTAFLSMWISNTASTLLMLPIGMAMISSLTEFSDRGSSASAEDDCCVDSSSAEVARFSVVLMLAIAYSASIGGFTSLVGTPTNVAFLGIWSEQFPAAPEFSAGEWMMAVLPLGVALLFCAWGLLTWRLPKSLGGEHPERHFFTEKLRQLGRPSRAEILMLIVFSITALLWIFRKPLSFGGTELIPGWGDGVAWILRNWGVTAESLHDSTVAIGMALLMFFIPAARDQNGQVQCLMDWETAERLPWGILLLIGGGFAIARGFKATGLAEWIGDLFAGTIINWPAWLLVLSVCLLLTFLTELTSNVATVSALMPILAVTAQRVGVDPRLMMIPAVISASCAFMLPIATPPNAIVFGSGKIRMGQMVRYGIALNFLGAVLITLVTFVWLAPQLGILFSDLPNWAKP